MSLLFSLIPIEHKTMDNRWFLSGASPTPQNLPSSPSIGFPVDGDPSTGQPATIAGSYWPHQIGEELRNVILYAGLTPAANVLNQLVTAIFHSPVFTGNPSVPTQSTSDNSYQAVNSSWIRSAMGNIASATGFQCQMQSTGFIVAGLISL